MIQEFKNQFGKALQALHDEVEKFNTETDLWKTEGTISNSSGNLALHLVGNVNHFIGAQLGNTGYVRQRDKEFSDKDVHRTILLAMIVGAKNVVEKSFDGMKEEDLSKVFPLDTFGPSKSTREVLLHLLSHFNYHLGQINYLRRVVSPPAM